MVVVSKKKGESKDAIFRKFTKLVMEEDIVDDIRNRQYYLKPSVKQKVDAKIRLKKRAQKRRALKNRRVSR